MFTGLDSTADHHLKADSEYWRMISWLRSTCAWLTTGLDALIPAD
jgi:hypothetical protein